ncbi:MAG: SDR family oxidoreductase [Ignavibacteriales bacterium]|nr:SDR family oxidoreductase [Ignavibacteriales bacterium]
MEEKDIPALYRPVVWITGASSGIGRETAKQFARLGCRVCVSARRKKELSVLVKEIIGLGGYAYPFPLDITNLAEIQKVAKQIAKQFGRVDVLINNAGITSFKSISETSIKEIDAILKTNLLGHIACIKSVLPSMIERKGGSIFNIISMVAVKMYENSGAYTASKSGMLGFGKVLREEVRNLNIKVVNVIPGATDTEIWNKKIREKYSDRMMKAKSVAEAILSVYQMPDDVVIDELVIRPITGDIN